VQNGQKEVWHLGGGQGVSAILLMRPGLGVAVTLLLNLSGLTTSTATAPAPILGLARQIAEIISPAP
jgi:hypothetical protein